ncbi:cleft lip and palate transmembrane protein 1, partial [Teladorsagia circumcincta]
MTDVVPAAAPEVVENQAEGGAWAAIKSVASRMLLIYFVTSMFKSYTSGPQNTDQNVTIAHAKYPPSRNLFPPGQLFDVYLYLDASVIYGVRQLNKFRKKYYKQTANLITGKSDQSEDDLEKAAKMKFEILNFWHPNLTISLVDDQTQWSKGSLPPPFDEAIKFDTDGGFYLPILYFNDYWNLASEYTPVNDTVKTRNKWSSMLGNDQEEDDQDAIKQALLETNPIVLGRQ